VTTSAGFYAGFFGGGGAVAGSAEGGAIGAIGAIGATVGAAVGTSMVWLRHKLADLSSRGSGGSGGAGGAGSCPRRVHWGKQGKHVPGHNNFEPGKSTLNLPLDWLDHPDEFLGTGTPRKGAPGMPGYQEVVDLRRVIGNYCTLTDPVGVPTTKITVHYSKTGFHVVPADPLFPMVMK
jgi:hypothetical protein